MEGMVVQRYQKPIFSTMLQIGSLAVQETEVFHYICLLERLPPEGFIAVFTTPLKFALLDLEVIENVDPEFPHRFKPGKRFKEFADLVRTVVSDTRRDYSVENP